MKVILDKEKCIGCGSCAVLCPKYFEMDETGKSKLKKGKPNPKNKTEELTISSIECIQDAVNSCPTQAIKIIKS